MMRHKRKNEKAEHGGDNQNLRPWKEVAKLFTQRTGESLTAGGAWTIGMRALRKLKQGLTK